LLRNLEQHSIPGGRLHSQRTAPRILHKPAKRVTATIDDVKGSSGKRVRECYQLIAAPLFGSWLSAVPKTQPATDALTRLHAANLVSSASF
jgi:hypothetical protein